MKGVILIIIVIAALIVTVLYVRSIRSSYVGSEGKAGVVVEGLLANSTGQPNPKGYLDRARGVQDIVNKEAERMRSGEGGIDSRENKGKSPGE